jgi:outer membrane protein, multidrug efflux system
MLLGHKPESIPRDKSIDALVLPEIPAGVPAGLLDDRPDVRGTEQNLVATNVYWPVSHAVFSYYLADRPLAR